MALNGLYCVDVPLSNYSLTHCYHVNSVKFLLLKQEHAQTELFDVAYSKHEHSA